MNRICKNSPINSLDHLETISKPLLKHGNNPYFRTLQVNWDKIVNNAADDFKTKQKIANSSKPKSIINIGSKDKKKNILVIELSSQSITQILQMRKNIIIEQMTLILGFRLIEDIKFEVNLTPEKEVEEYIEKFENLEKLLTEEEILKIISTVGMQDDESARSALIKLGISLKAKEKLKNMSKNDIKNLF